MNPAAETIKRRTTMSDTRINTRPIQSHDMDFLYRVYASTREAELAATGWSEAKQTAFLRQQFNAQHAYYQQQFRDASYEIVFADNQPMGRLYLDKRDDEIRIIDIALLPQYRGQGIGSGLLRQIMRDADSTGLAVSIHVEKFNPALRLYKRLAFAEIENQGVYILMRYSAPSD